MTRSRSHWVASIALLGGSCIIALLLMEIATRFMGLATLSITDPLFQPSADPGVSYEFKPNARGFVWGHTKLETNSYGLRGPEVRVPKPPGTYRVGIFGDSATFGQGVTDEETYARVLERMLSERFVSKGLTVEVLNFGVPSYSITNIVSAFAEKGVRFDLDIAVLAPILEDFGFHRNHKADQYGYPVNASTPMNPGPVKNLLRHVHLAYLVRDAYWSLTGAGSPELRALTESNDTSDLDRATWERGDQEINRFAAVARQRGIVPIYVALGRSAPRIDAVVGRLGLQQIRTLPVAERYSAAQLQVSARDAHPSALYHNLIAGELFQVIAPVIQAEMDRHGASAGLRNGNHADAAGPGE